MIITDESPISYYYSKKETHFYPNPWNLAALNNLAKESYKDKQVYVFFTDYDMPLNEEEHIQIKRDLDANFEAVFECKNNSWIYKL